MAKGKKNPIKSGDVEKVAEQQSVVMPGMFPIKPKRGPNEKPPGISVRLISNLFKMYLKSNRPIFKTTVTVELIRDDAGAEKSDPDSKTVKPPVKLGNEYRRMAVEKAISEWLSDNMPSNSALRNINFIYIFDANASIMYSLFDLFPSKTDGEEKEFRVTLQLDTIIDKQLKKRSQLFKVILFKKDNLDLKYLFDYCQQKIPADNTKVQEHLRAMNVILRGKISTLPNMVLTQFNVFPFDKKYQFEAGPGVIVNKGFSTSVRPAECGVILNVANTVCSFHEEVDLIDLVKKKYRNVDLSRGLSDEIKIWLKKELFNKQVEARHINYGTKLKPHYRKYRVGDICGSGMDKFTLVDKDKKTTKEVTIAQYFKDEHKTVLKYPKLPCVVDKGRKIPLEVCHLIEKQRVNRRMDPNETATIIKQTALRPDEHFKLVQNNANLVKSNSEPLNNFGLDFETKPIEVDGRELKPVALLAGGQQTIPPRDGQYMTDRNSFYKPATIKRWSLTFLVDFDVERDKQKNGQNALFERRFSDLYCEQAKKRGMNIKQLEAKYCNHIPVTSDEGKLKNTLVQYFKFLNREKVDHCIFVLPNRCPDWMYRYLQYLEASTQEGRGPEESWTRTSCLQYKNYRGKIFDSRDQGNMFISNLLLKYNTKLGGINFIIDRRQLNPTNYHFLKGDCIFISVDVCHPAPGDKLIQSVAAVVGMWDLCDQNLSYCTRIRVQKKMRENHSTIEEVGEIDIMFGEVIERYRDKKGLYPARIIILRDGVSEGQFRTVLNYELGKVRSCLSNKYKNLKCKEPLITCLVVQKRHKVRFMRKEAVQTRKGPDYNIQPGTVVDTTVTHPTDFSFYLAPHKAIQGTSRAAHIYIICDEIKFTQDQAQAMVHVLSYLSPRCTKSTSIPTPVNLADLAAEQGKNLVISWNDAQAAKMTDEDRLKKLNHFLSNLADKNYQYTLYYI